MSAETQAKGEVLLQIARLGSQGDGVAENCPGVPGPVFVPFALPGETVVARVAGERGELVSVERASGDRVAPLCRHFAHCGGCDVQHMSAATYAAWKRQLVVDAFAQRGLAADVAPLAEIPPGTRRRAVLSGVMTRNGIVLGFHAARDRTIVDVEQCPVLTPRLAAFLPAVRRLLAALPRFEGEARVTLIEADNGISVAVADAVSTKELNADVVSRIAAAAAEVTGLLRLSIAGDAVYQRAAPEIAMGRARVVPPADVFLQAAHAAEAAMVARVLAALPKKVTRVVDLFAGVGAFTFPLAERASVLAVDSDATALGALKHAARNAQGLKPIETRVRDLFREPLSRKELEGCDVAVLDPPRAGAKAQSEMLAKSKVPVVVMVSCNPATLARDVRILVDGGYVLGPVTPIDQFVFTAHVEAVAVLTRPKA